MNRQSNKITALYCRTAYDVPGADETVRKNQMEALIQYAADHQLENPRFYCDWGFSGVSQDRPEYQRMLREAEAGNVSCIVVVNLSRLGRGYTTYAALIESLLPRYDIALHSVQDGGDIAQSLHEMAEMQVQLLEAYRLYRRGGRA